MYTSGTSFTFLVGDVFKDADWLCFRFFEGEIFSVSEAEPSEIVDCILIGAPFELEEPPRRFREYVAVILLLRGSGPKDAEVEVFVIG
ncbi:hypothetical protein ACEPAF_9751 [Sanghuangporus sanghuang]